MINLLDKALRRLREETTAAAAVVWSARAKAAAASVLTCSPADLLPSGAMWPSGDFGEIAAAELDAQRLTAALPAALRDKLDRPLHAARSFQLGNELFLTLMWCDPAPTAPEGPNPLIFDEISYLAGLLAESRFNLGEVERLRAVVNSLEDAVVTVDTVLGQASVNASAAELLTLPPGKNPASTFWAAMTDLSSRAVNRDQSGAELKRLKEDPLAQIECTLHYRDSPTHLKLISRAIHQPGFKGRTWVFRDESQLSQALTSAENARDVLRASADGMLEPQALLEAVRDESGAIVDFVYRDVNRAVSIYLGLSREGLVGHSLLETMPNLAHSGLLQRYADCVETREPLVLDEVLYDNEILSGPRYYDIRGNHVAGDSINLIWRDVTDRFIAAKRIAESEQHYRLLAENAGDTVIHVRDGHIAWISPGVEEVLGAPPEHWIGRQLAEIIPAEDRGAHEKVTWLSEDRAVIPRGRITAADGTTHWVHVHAKTYYDADGGPDGYTSSFRIIDDEVRAVEAAEEARRRQAEADARYRRLMDNSAVPMCVTSPDGRFDVVNEAMCRYFGYDAETLRTKTWAELAAPEYLESDLAELAEMIAGKTDTHRGVKEYFHADGHRIWGDLSVSCLRKPDGEVESIIAQIIDITEQMKTHKLAEQARREEAVARARYRNLMDNAAVGMGVIAPDGRLEEVNQAACDFFGYDADALLEMTWQQLTAPEYMDADMANVENMMAGKIDSFRLTKQF
ncbi:MAG: PAS domain S-box protein, partial [Mycobacterium sp.]